MAQINGFVDKSNPKSREQLIQDIKQIKLDNIGVLRQYSDIIKIVNQQYKNIILVKKQEHQIDFEEFLTENVKGELEYKVAEFHNQKSNQHFKDIESGKYTVPPPYVENKITPLNTQNVNEDSKEFDNKPIEEKSLIERPSGLKAYASNLFNKLKNFDLLNKIKESNLFKKITNSRKNNEIENEKVDLATEKMEALKKGFDSRITVSKEELEKNRMEYEQQKQKTATISISRNEQEGQEHE